MSSDRTKEELFLEHASVEQNGRRYMTPDDFLKCWGVTNPIDPAKFKIFFRLADRDGSGLIDFDEFVFFDNLMKKPDVDYQIAFKIFDGARSGLISKDEVIRVMQANVEQGGIPFDFNSDLFTLFFGKDGQTKLSYPEFALFLKLLETEKIRQEFKYYDKNGRGYIPGSAVAKSLSTAPGQEYIPQPLKDALIASLGQRERVSFPEFVAFHNVLRGLDEIERIVKIAAHRKRSGVITKDDYIRAASTASEVANYRLGHTITPMEVDFLFRLFPEKDKSGKINTDHLDVGRFLSIMKYRPAPQGGAIEEQLFPEEQQQQQQQEEEATPAPVHTQLAPEPTATTAHSVLVQTIKSIQNFGLGAIAGGIGAFAVYPIDLVKTRMQNQRSIKGGPRLYENSFDCFRKTLRNEGVLGLYKGLGPQLVGVAPEKAIKLTVNDLLRDMFKNKEKGDIYFPLEVLAGGGAGASQVIFTNPLEIVKIRLQVAGESGQKANALKVIKDLGFFGLYKGAGACLLRDIPFSAIYFPTYAKMKTVMADENGKLGPTGLLISGAVAGIPAASLVTPADVIKTRLQVQARAGETTYSGIRDCFWKILKYEGPTALFKGCAARVFRSSPQFGVTLLSYELLQRIFAPGVTPRPPTNVPVSVEDFNALRRRRQVLESKVTNLERKWGPIFSAGTDVKGK